jgi:hypothetical protein
MIVIDYILVGAGHKFRKAVKGSLPLTATSILILASTLRCLH